MYSLHSSRALLSVQETKRCPQCAALAVHWDPQVSYTVGALLSRLSSHLTWDWGSGAPASLVARHTRGPRLPSLLRLGA